MPPLDKRIKKFLKDSIRIAPKISGKGELSELRTGLVSQYPQTRKDAIKKTIQQMTLGKDVSSLFPDVLKNIATIDVEQKKLVYLYVMNYAETHPELCILAVNTFITDAQDPNPLIRCMAIRTMSMIRVDKILEYIETPLRRTLHDDNAYVRKTAVICVAKLFQLNKDLCVELGVVEDLVNALDDSNPLVIANATAALIEIHNMDMDAVDLSSLIQSHVSQFLLALNECTEWARIIILGTLSEYSAKDSLEAQDIIDRVTAHLQHVNPAVVLATIKVIVRNLPQIEYSSNSLIMKRLSSAFVSLMSTPPEMQYVALKNIRIILEKYPELLTKELRIFYVKFNDPLYVKLEKIDILVRLVDPSNLKQCTLLLTELKEYAMEYEPEFVSRAIQALSQLGIKYAQESFVSKVLDILLELLERQDTIKDDCCISLCDLLRLCPGNDKMAKQVCAVFNTWSNPEVLLQSDIAKCNYVWLLGQHPNNFSDLESKINIFIENFVQEEALTQMSLLMTIVRLHATLTGSMLQSVLELATQQTHELDVRDMAMMYWRCLSMPNNESLVNDLCQNKLPMISNTLEKFSPEVLEKLLMELGTISSIYFKPDSNRRKGKKYVQNIVKGKHIEELESMAKNEISSKANDDVLLDFDERDDVTNTNAGMLNTSTTLGDLDDLFDFGPPEDATQINTNDTKAVQGLKELKLGGDSNGISSGGKNNPDVSGGNIVSQDLLDLF
ncbi:ASN_HP2_G0030720.mRNA.1.CDS.1 [Saccharomyces cerevisiae]|nr:ASN_HP2_G0030720.mRNA.1.CDS.1 [Saccharomyces cerevisiae]CAI6577241.1 ASN_HP1_G0031630.mRNA.1.CDS.1 [Saccharomyces cerevisiae]CAI6686723.1 ASN_HP2_G0030720.mRNA.1.CDS.1 [Saccharomyces cerevisiae]